MEFDYEDIVLTAPVQESGFPGDEIASDLATRYRELQKIMQITARVNAGLFLDEVLESVYRDFKEFIPYDRIGFSLIEDEGKIVRSHWVKADYSPLRLERGYAAPLAGSSLEMIMNTGQPRIINDLQAYSQRKPGSKSTRLMLEEGIRSSLTCPLIANGVPVGFLYFSSREPNMYASVHIDIFVQIAGQLSVIVEKAGMVAELSAQKRELEQKNEELRRLNDLKNSFLGVAAHDLRNPIGSIQMAMSLLIDEGLTFTAEEQAKMLVEVEKHAHFTLNLLDDLLDISHIESGKFILEPEPLDLEIFLKEAVQHHHKLAESKGSAVHLEPIGAGQVLGDPMRLRQVMDNLISNAVKYSPAGSRVVVSATQEKGEWWVAVRDEGPGLTEEDQRLVFQDFVRLSAKPTGGEKSTGLGLAITRRVIEAHGGRIGVHSEPGQGATFWYTLKPVK